MPAGAVLGTSPPGGGGAGGSLPRGGSGNLPMAAAAAAAAGTSADGGQASSLTSGGLTALEALRRRRTTHDLLTRLQRGRRPTAAPAWMAGGDAADAMAPQAVSRLAAATAAAAALESIGHHAAAVSAAAAAGVLPPAVGGAVGSMLGALDEEGQRLLKGLQRKLQQITALEELAAGGRALDAAQHAKMSQKGALTEALRVRRRVVVTHQFTNVG